MATRARSYYGSYPRARRNQRRSGGLAPLLLAVATALAAWLGYVAIEPESLPIPTAPSARAPAPAPDARPEAGPTDYAAIGAVMTGRVSVVDGDTLDLHGQRVRLSGVDAPESGQKCADASGKLWKCGAAAANALDRFIAGRPVACHVDDVDRYGRSVSTCRVDGEDIQHWLARNGYALAYRQYSTKYVAAEEAAKASGKGMWAGAFVAPADWRKGQRLPGEPETKAMREGRVPPRADAR
jgi:endonuclease YncB( thermonuclease family)